MSNGSRSTQRDQGETYHDHTIPLPKEIRRVEIHHTDYCIKGFSFFDKDWLPIYKIGLTIPGWDVETVLLSEDEVIVGVKAKLHPDWQSVYTDFQFEIGRA